MSLTNPSPTVAQSAKYGARIEGMKTAKKRRGFR
jgi:hypothetical protein